MGDERLASARDTELRSRLAAIVESSVDAILGKTLDGIITDWNAATVARDISERKRAETERRTLQARLRRAERMEIAGQLAGGIAHNFRNLIGVISGYAVLLEDEAGDNPQMQAIVSDIQSAADKAGRLASDLAGVGGPDRTPKQHVDLAAHLSGNSTLLQAGLGGRIRLCLQLADALPAMQASQGQLEQVLLNLAVNARDAMPEGGTLTIAADLDQPTVPPAHQPPGGPSGRYVQITVSDTGTGMSPQVTDRIFDPFYTTKSEDTGAGLGLFTVHQIITQLGGDIDVRSREQAGTTFIIRLPATGNRAADMRIES